jgi:putative oxidoreductase
MKESVRRWAPLPLRLMLGIAFIYHGWPKIFSASGHAGVVGTLQGIGFPLPVVTAWVVGFLELVGGVALLFGIFATFFGVFLTIEMLCAMFLVHWKAGFNFVHVTGMGPNGPVFGLPGYEVNLLYIAGLLSLILSGPGKLALGRVGTAGGARRGSERKRIRH